MPDTHKRGAAPPLPPPFSLRTDKLGEQKLPTLPPTAQEPPPSFRRGGLPPSSNCLFWPPNPKSGLLLFTVLAASPPILAAIWKGGSTGSTPAFAGGLERRTEQGENQGPQF